MARLTNLPNQHRKKAEKFLTSLQERGAIPSEFSGVMCPKFGKYIMIWQFAQNKLVGSVVVHVNNIDNFKQKLTASKVSIMDWLNSEFFGGSVGQRDGYAADGSRSREETVRDSNSRSESDSGSN